MMESRELEILLADDDADDREFFREALIELFPHVSLTEFENGEELMVHLEHIQEPPPPDMIFLDINMPGKNGKECLKEIRSHVKFCHVPIIMFTVSNALEDIDETYRCGANLYIRKAHSLHEWLETLKGIFGEYHNKTMMNIPKDKYFIGTYH